MNAALQSLLRDAIGGSPPIERASVPPLRPFPHFITADKPGYPGYFVTFAVTTDPFCRFLRSSSR
jgi:hypothetical protein